MTSRGIAIVDVDYGGSTGYGREYRRRLDGQWGVVDVDDCVAAAQYLVERGDVDPDRLAIEGGSAGGYTTLAALAFRDVFAAGISLFGIGDLELLDTDSHKFESHYNRPPGRARTRRRPPSTASARRVNFPDRFSAPVLILQGLDDKVVPPSQAESIVAALAKNVDPVRVHRVRGRGPRVPRRVRAAADARGAALVPRPGLRLRAGRRRTSRSRCPGSMPGWRAADDPCVGRRRERCGRGLAAPAPARARARLRAHEHRRRRPLPVHLRIGHRGPSGQDVRPGLRRHPGRDHPRGPERPGRLRDGDDDGPGHGPRRDLDDHLHRHPGGRPRHGPRHRLHPGRLRLRLPDLRHADLGQGAVARHRPGRRFGARGPRRRGIHVRARGRRPGDDVRLRLPRDARADAAADRPRPPDGAPPVRGPQDRASSRTSGPTARPRSRSSTSTASRSGSGRSSSRPSTTPTSAPSGCARRSSKR